MRLLLPLFAACLLGPAHFFAQCPVILNCPAQLDTFCDVTGNNPLFWNETYWFDPVHQLNDLSDAPVDLSVRALDSCAGGPLNISYILWLDLDGDGVMETIVRSDSTYTPGTIRYNNLQTPGGEVRVFDQRPAPDEEKYRFALETATAGDTAIARLRWNTTANPDVFFEPQLPAGLHRIRWIAETPQGAEKWCTYTFSVRDCAPPAPVCLNGVSGNMMPAKFLRIWDTDLLLNMQDNQTPATQLQTAVRKSGAGAGFPLLPDGSPAQSVTFTCDELGAHTVELWARDRAGNTGYCETTVIVMDNSGFCGDPAWPNVCITRYCDDKGMEEVNVNLKGNHPALPPVNLFGLTNNDGCASLQAIPFIGNYTITPQKDDIPFTTTADIERVRRHLDGSEPFTDPYQWVAADVNHDNAVDSADVAEMEQLALGLVTTWTNNAPWRFIPKSYIFPSPDPLAVPVPSSISLDLPGGNFDYSFVGVRTGDLDLCAGVGVTALPAISFAGPAQPNPSSAAILIPLQLRRAAEVRLEIFDFQGRKVYSQIAHLPPGQVSIEAPGEAFPGGGVYGWRVFAEGVVTAGKVLRW